MISVTKHKFKRYVLLLLGAVIITVLFLSQYILPDTAEAGVDPEAVLDVYGDDPELVFAGIRNDVKSIIDKWGIEGVLEVKNFAFTNNRIGMYHCHTLAHLIGHEAVYYYDFDYEQILTYDNAFCELGYRHGVEAEVTLQGTGHIDELHKMCEIIKKNNPSNDCFHGAGHAFMNESLDVEQALLHCDSLQNHKYGIQDVTPCYNAVFAELTNLVGGTDGETGVPYSSGPPMSLEGKTTLEYCDQFSEQYRLQCVFEFSGLGVSQVSTPKDIELKLRQCTQNEYDSELEAGCVKSVAAVGTQHELTTANTPTVHPFILSESPEIREAFILGAGVEMLQYLRSGAVRDWRTFCGSFTEPDDVGLCTSIYQDYE